jgi:hypothetical protein
VIKKRKEVISDKYLVVQEELCSNELQLFYIQYNHLSNTRNSFGVELLKHRYLKLLDHYFFMKIDKTNERTKSSTVKHYVEWLVCTIPESNWGPNDGNVGFYH